MTADRNPTRTSWMGRLAAALGRSRATRPSAARRARLGVEALEDRRTPSTATLSHGVLTVTGTRSDDFIIVGQFNGVIQAVDGATGAVIAINGRDPTADASAAHREDIPVGQHGRAEEQSGLAHAPGGRPDAVDVIIGAGLPHVSRWTAGRPPRKGGPVAGRRERRCLTARRVSEPGPGPPTGEDREPGPKPRLELLGAGRWRPRPSGSSPGRRAGRRPAGGRPPPRGAGRRRPAPGRRPDRPAGPGPPPGWLGGRPGRPPGRARGVSGAASGPPPGHPAGPRRAAAQGPEGVLGLQDLPGHVRQLLVGPARHGLHPPVGLVLR